jgi:glutathione peroxidase-family protein
VLLEFSGQGNEATRLYPLDAGLIRCDYTHVGQSQFEFNFMAYLLDSQGDMAALVANEIGSCEGSSAGSIGSGGDYLLNVTADGDWTFRCDVNAPGTEPSPRQPVPVVELSGHGNEASDLIHLEGGLVRADYTHVGESEFEFNFMAYLLDSQGNMAALVANEIGSCEGSSASSIARAGDYVLDVTADGNWTITLSQ